MTNEGTPLKQWLDGERGRAADLARALGVTPQTIGGWANGKAEIPPSRCWQIEQHTGIRVEALNSSVQWVRASKRAPPIFVPKPARMSAKRVAEAM